MDKKLIVSKNGSFHLRLANKFLFTLLTFAIFTWSQTDLANHKNATASSVEGTYVAANAVDGNGATRWSTNYSDPQWIRIDLGATYSFTRVVLVWEAASARDYRIEVSATGTDPWSPIVTRSNMASGARTDNIIGLTASSRYIRMYGTARTSNYGYSLYSFEVYNEATSNFTITTNVNPVGAGTVTLNPPGGSYAAGTVVRLTPNASSGYQFTNWSGGLSGNSNPGTITVSANATITAVFSQNTSTYQTGDLKYYDGTNWVRIPKGNAGQILTEGIAQIPLWVSPTMITDIDGNLYSTVTIGSQTWMNENLKTTRLNDGSLIPNVIDPTQWTWLTTPGYAWYNNDIANRATYGALYNWYTVNTSKLAPVGWHVPTDADWARLSSYLGGDQLAGGLLKTIGINYWNTPNNYAANSYAYSALPGGYRNGTFSDVRNYGYWWSATEATTDNGSFRYISYLFSDLGRNNINKSYGFSVRLVRDY
jgi:uncharacterized protein (TIGR02145 family)